MTSAHGSGTGGYGLDVRHLVYSGDWRVEGDCLRLEIANKVGDRLYASFPVRIDPAGEHLYMTRSVDGISPPFFDGDMFSMTLTLRYG